MNILVINCGSSSVKFKVFNMGSNEQVLKGKVEEIGTKVSDHSEALKLIIAQTKDIKIDCIGHRVVHGGEKFVNPALLNDSVIVELKKLEPLAPLHNPFNVLGIEMAKKQ